MSDRSLIYGHDVESGSGCRSCGASDTSLPCPRAETCVCTSMRRSGFTNVGDARQEWWVCPECGRPTAPWLESTLESVGLTPGQYLSEDESTMEAPDD